MLFKDEKVRGEYYQTPTFLQVICADFETECAKLGIIPVVTRVFEHVLGDSGVHEAHRAVDFRDEHPPGEFTFSVEQRAAIAKVINDKYSRNDGKPTLLFHSFVSPDGDKSPLHCHIQQASTMSVYSHQTKEQENA